MIDFFEKLDQKLLLLINGIHFDWLDPIMKFVSSNWLWFSIIALFISLSIVYYKKKFWVPIVFAILCYVLTENGSHFCKETVKRYRPTHNLEIGSQVHTVDNYRGGKYGFFSGHAADGFGLALITLLFIRKKFYTIIVISWTVIVSYSRMYLGVHYPFDVFCGMIWGLISATAVFLLYKRLKIKIKYLT